MFSLRPIDRFKFFVERQFVKGAHYQLLFMALVLVVISVVAGAVVLGTEADESYGEAVWWAFLRLSDPGYLGDDEGLLRRVVSTILTMSGYVLVLGTVVAILTRWLISFMRHLERGLTPVAMHNHFVIVGWTNRTVAISAKLLAQPDHQGRWARMWRKKKGLAVLAEDVSAELSHELRLEPNLRGRSSDIVLRSGSALNTQALQRVASLNAAAIILPTQVFDTQELITSDIQTVKTLLSLDGLTKELEDSLPLVVAEVQDVRKVPVARRAYRGPLEVVAGDQVISRLIAHSLRQPGLTRVYHELLTSRSVDPLQIRPTPEMRGLTIDEVQQSLDDEILLGVVRPTGDQFVSHLAASPDFPIADDDRLVVLVRGNSEADDEDWSMPSKGSVQGRPDREWRKILILGWSEKLLSLLEELKKYGADDGQITVVSTLGVAERKKRMDDYGLDPEDQLIRHIDADFTVRHRLREVSPGEYDNITLISSDRLESGGEADARTIVGYLLLREILDDVQASPQVIIELADARNRELLGDRPGEVIVSSLLLSNLLAQIAAHRELKSVLDDLFSVEGAKIDFHPAQRYGLKRGDYTFRQLASRVRKEGEILLGFPGNLNPPGQRTLSVEPGDDFIVMSS